MEDPVREIVYPTVQQVCEVNRRMIQQFGGHFVSPDNLENLDALEYILAAISGSIYGEVPYPSLKAKAAALAYHIISRHVFTDGNKRTGIHMAWMVLQSNEARVFLEPTVVDLAVDIGAGQGGHNHLLEWLHGHQEE